MTSLRLLTQTVLAFMVAGLLSSCSPQLEAPATSLVTSTWSIVAADPTTGDMGVAGASCVPNFHGDVLAALVPSQGAAASQAYFELANRNRAFEMLKGGTPAPDIIRHLSDPTSDSRVDLRQYGVVTLIDGRAEVAAYSGAGIPNWAGDRQDPDMAVTVQGNSLAGEAVVVDSLQAFLSTDLEGQNTLPDRLMRALEAGSQAGGDLRCNNDQVTQTAATAFILVARGSDPPYAAPELGATDAGTPNAPWLAISVVEDQFGPNPILELRRQYDSWRVIAYPIEEEGRQLAATLVAVGLLALVLAIAAANWYRRGAGRS